MRITLCLLSGLLLGACAPLTSPERVDVLSAEVQAVRGLKAKQRIVVEALEPAEFNRRWRSLKRTVSSSLLGAKEALAASQPAASEDEKSAPLAFYDARTKKIFASRTIELVAAASGVVAAQIDLVRAIESALQDQYFDLAKFLQADSTDETYARQGLLKADAELTTVAWLENKPRRRQAAPPKPEPVSSSQIWDPLLDIGITALDAIAPIYRSYGWEGINALFAQPPTSTAQLFSASGLRGEYKPLRFGSAFWPGDCKQVWADRLGPAMMSYFSEGAPSDLALHWLGDQVELCQATDNSLQVVWSIEFRHSEDARTALESMRQRFLSGPHRLLDEEPDDFPGTPSTDRFVEPAWPIAGTQNRNLVVVWSNLPLAQRKVGQELRSMAFVFAPKVATRRELRDQAAAAGDKKDYATCSRSFLEVAALGGDWTDHYNAACCFANAGDSDSAFSELKLLYGTRFSALDTLLKDPDLDSLRDKPEWPKLLARLSDSQKLYAKILDPELHAMLATVQKDARITEDYRAQVARAKELIGNGKAHSADDYYAAAFVLLTSEALADVEQARALANRAADMDPSFTEANQLTASAEDRRLLLIGQPQKFGTQRIKHNGRIELYPVEPTFYDHERAEWDMPTFEEMQQRVRETAPASSPAVP